MVVFICTWCTFVLFPFNTVVLNTQIYIADFLIVADNETKAYAHLADGQNSYSGFDTHLAHELVRDNATKDNANTTNNYRYSKQPPPKVIIWEVVLEVQITVVCEAETPCETMYCN